MTLELVPWRGSRVPVLGGDEISRASVAQYVQWVIDSQYYVGAPPPVTTTYGDRPAEQISISYEGFARGMLYSDTPVAAVEGYRLRVFGQAPLLYQEIEDGRPGDFVDDERLDILRSPWPGGTLADLAKRALLHGDLAGNAFVVDLDDELVLLRPDWVEIILQKRDYRGGQLGWRQVGIMYYEGGLRSGDGVPFMPGEYAHFVPGLPDPLATYRGMSWLTPLIKEVQADRKAHEHKLAFFEHAATPNLAVSLPKEITSDQFEKFVDKMDAQHKGAMMAGKTLYMGAGADVKVVGASMQDFSGIVGKGETRVANAGAVPPTLLSFSEGMQGSSLNSGNYTAAKRNFVDTTMRDLWQNWCGSLQQMDRFKPADRNMRVWYDGRDIPFLHEDAKDLAEIQQGRMTAINAGVTAGFTPASVVPAIVHDDLSLLVPSGFVSVQLQPVGPNGTQPPSTSPSPYGDSGGSGATPHGDTSPQPDANAEVPYVGRSVVFDEDDELSDAIDEILRHYNPDQARIAKGHEGGGRFGSKLTALLEAWLKGEGPDDPLHGASRQSIVAAAKKRGIVVPPRMALPALKAALLASVREEHVSGKKPDATAPGATKGHQRFSITHNGQRIDVGIFTTPSSGKLSVYRESDSGVKQGRAIKSFDDMGALAAWADSNGHTDLAEYAHGEAEVPHVPEAPVKKATPAKSPPKAVDDETKFRAEMKKLSPPFGSGAKSQWDDARLRALGYQDYTPERAVEQLDADIVANEERLRQHEALGIEPHLQQRTMRALPDDIERQREMAALIRKTFGLPAGEKATPAKVAPRGKAAVGRSPREMSDAELAALVPDLTKPVKRRGFNEERPISEPGRTMDLGSLSAEQTEALYEQRVRAALPLIASMSQKDALARLQQSDLDFSPSEALGIYNRRLVDDIRNASRSDAEKLLKPKLKAELQAIADEAGAKYTSRTTKPTLIAAILDEVGHGEAPGESVPNVGREAGIPAYVPPATLTAEEQARAERLVRQDPQIFATLHDRYGNISTSGNLSREDADWLQSVFEREPAFVNHLAQQVSIERELDREAKQAGQTPAAYRAEVADKLKAAVHGKPVVVRVTDDGLSGILSEGRFRTQFERGTKRAPGLTADTKRRKLGEEILGTPADTPTERRPVYGYVAIGGVEPALSEGKKVPGIAQREGQQDVLSSYGKVQVVLKQDVRPRTTITVGDSLDEIGFVRPSPIDNPTAESAGKRLKFVTDPGGTRSGYVEAQIHGGVAASDIAEVVFPSEPSAATVSKLQEKGIPWRVLRPGDPAIQDAGESVNVPNPDGPARQAEVDNRIRQAYRAVLADRAAAGVDVADENNRFVSLADIRDHIGEDIPRGEVDDALRRMRGDGVRVIPLANLKGLKQRDRDSAVRIGDTEAHALYIPDAGPAAATPTDPNSPERQAAVETSVREAYREAIAAMPPAPNGRPRAAGDRVPLTDIRERVGSDVSRDELDAGLRRLTAGDPNVARLEGQENQQRLTEADRAAAVTKGRRTYHFLSLQNPGTETAPNPDGLDSLEGPRLRSYATEWDIPTSGKTDDQLRQALRDQGIESPERERQKRIAEADAEAAAKATPQAVPAEVGGQPIRRQFGFRTSSDNPAIQRRLAGGDEKLVAPNGSFDADQGLVHLDSNIGRLWSDLVSDDRVQNSTINEVAQIGRDLGRNQVSYNDTVDRLRVLAEQHPGVIGDRIGNAVRELSDDGGVSEASLDVRIDAIDAPERVKAWLRQVASVPMFRRDNIPGQGARDSWADQVIDLAQRVSVGERRGPDGQRFMPDGALQEQKLHESVDGVYAQNLINGEVFNPPRTINQNGKPVPNPEYEQLRRWLSGRTDWHDYVSTGGDAGPEAAADPNSPQRQAAVETAIRDAYARALSAQGGGNRWIPMASLRAELADAGYSRTEVDAALRRLIAQPDVSIVPESNQKVLTPDDRAAEVIIGNQPKHFIEIAPTAAEVTTSDFGAEAMYRELRARRSGGKTDPLMAALSDAELLAAVDERRRRDPVVDKAINRLGPLPDGGGVGPKAEALPERTPGPRVTSDRPPAAPVPVGDLFDADDATIEAVMKDVYEGQFGPYATKVEVSVTRAGTRTDGRGRVHPVEPKIYIGGKIYDADGHEIGYFGRSIGPVLQGYPDGTVRREVWADHKIVQLGDGDYDENPTKYHGKGFGREFNGRAIDWYRRSGVHGITQDDHNGYVWASQGFGFNGGVWPDYKQEDLRDLIADLRASETKTKYEETIPTQLRNAPDLDAQIAEAEALLARARTTKPGEPGYPTAYEVSQVGRNGRRGKTKTWIGKFLGVSAGELILNPDEGEVVSGG